MKYLYTIGCSYSEGHGLDDPEKERYSKFLAEKLGCEDLNRALGGASNQRIFRKIFEYIVDNPDKLTETMFVIQVTYPMRNEVTINSAYSNFIVEDEQKKIVYTGEDSGVPTDLPSNERDYWVHSQVGNEGKITRWGGAWEEWQKPDSEGRNLMYIPKEETLQDVTWRWLISLQSFFKLNNIKYIFFQGSSDYGLEHHLDANQSYIRDDQTIWSRPIHKLCDTKYFYPETFYQYAGEDRLTVCKHPNAEVQVEWADKLYNFIKEVYGD
jgi:hypothetical protein